MPAADRDPPLKVLLVNQHYPPDLGATGRVAADLAEGLVARGHVVSVLTGQPSYPETRDRRVPRHEVRRGVDVVRLAVARRREGAFGRGLHYVTFAIQSLRAGLPSARPDAVIAFSSTPTLGGVSALLLARARRCPLIYVVQDLHPEMAIALGSLREGMLARIARALDSLTWRGASRVVVIGEEMRKAASGRGVASERLTVIPNWADAERLVPQETSALRHRLGFSADDFVVQYAGNLGRAQDLRAVVRAVEQARAEDERVRLLVVGGGSAERELTYVARGAPGVRRIPFQREEEVADVLAAADLGIVSLRAGLSRWCVPSKIYSILASARPVGAMLDAESDVAKVVESARCGFRVDPGDCDGLAQEIVRLARDRAEARRLGRNGRAWLEREGGAASALDRYDRLLGEVVHASSAREEQPTLERGAGA
jgi:glycosyltransferase involved in cell wall biosynthesis